MQNTLKPEVCIILVVDKLYRQTYANKDMVLFL